MSNVENFDILAIHKKTYKQYAIQVKTTGYKRKEWTLAKKNEDLVITGLGFIKFTKDETIKVSVLKGVKVFTRKSLV